ncbi:hypothetical protein [Maribellus mangrovi]|uniref:hypothetical protein n=1 Tax=Maribellus mangrovi TaxID=3133146 RepID=UPI0030EECAE1
METLTSVISFILLLGLIAVPIILFIAIKKWYRLKFDFIAYLALGLILTAGIMWTFAWWADYSDQFLMRHYGYDLNAMNDTERFANVESENLEKVKQLEIGYLGVGWPLKAIMSFVFYSPYLLIVFGIGQLIRRMKRKKNMHLTKPIRNAG